MTFLVQSCNDATTLSRGSEAPHFSYFKHSTVLILQANLQVVKRNTMEGSNKAPEPSFNRFCKSVDYLCILDFEATCNKQGKQPRPQEIIEFPVLLFNVATGEVEKEFHYYIRPDVHPTLSEFCTELTGIRQSQVDETGISLEEALKRHKEWLNECGIVAWHLCTSNDDKTFLYLTCGDWDLNVCLPRQLSHHGQSPMPHFEAWINIKKEFSKKYMSKAKGMKGMLDFYCMELEGRHHSGIDDCRNIARICRQMMEEGWVPKGPTN